MVKNTKKKRTIVTYFPRTAVSVGGLFHWR